MENNIFNRTLEDISPVKDFINGCDVLEQAKIYAILDLLGNEGINLHRPYSDLLCDGIHELRIKLSGQQNRILYFFAYQNYIVLTNTFIKTTDKVPSAEVKKALAIKADFLNRYNINTIEEFYAENRFL